MAIEVVDYGIDHSQYFHGHGTAYTPFDHSSLGVGASFQEALEDAIEQMYPPPAFDVDAAIARTYDLTAAPFTTAYDQQTQNELMELVADHEESELYYYVGLRWNA